MVLADNFIDLLKTTIYSQDIFAIMSECCEIANIILESSLSSSDFMQKHINAYIKLVANSNKIPPVKTLINMIFQLQTDQDYIYYNIIDSIIYQLYIKYSYNTNFIKIINIHIYQDICNNLISYIQNWESDKSKVYTVIPKKTALSRLLSSDTKPKHIK